jgi:hypothetical protein
MAAAAGFSGPVSEKADKNREIPSPSWGYQPAGRQGSLTLIFIFSTSFFPFIL